MDYSKTTTVPLFDGKINIMFDGGEGGVWRAGVDETCMWGGSYCSADGEQANETLGDDRARGLFIAEGINLFAATAYGNSRASGWWTDPETGDDLLVAAERFAPLVVGAKIALMHSELSEALEGQRKDRKDDHLPHRLQLEVELADAMIRIADLAGRLGLDLGGAIREKMAYNASRADHKPENRAAEGGKQF